MDSTLFASHLRDLRTSHGMSAETLAAAAHVTLSEYHTWEDGDARPTAEQMLQIAAALGIPAEDVIYGGMTMLPLDDGTTEEERRSAREAVAAEIERKYTRGKRILCIIIVLEVISMLLGFLSSPSLFSLVIYVFIAAALISLWNGHTWAKWVFIVLSGFDALLCLFALLVGAIGVIFSLVYNVAVCILLLTNTDVDTFLSEQNT